MITRRLPAVLLLLLAATSAVSAAGCGSSPQDVEQARAQAAEQQRLKDKAAALEGEIKQLKEQQVQLVQTQTTQDQATTRDQTTQAPRGPSRNCGAGVAAGPNTSCAFALNTAKEWVDTSAGTTIQVFSPATKKSYTMNCSTGPAGTTCKGGNGAVVSIP